MRTWLLAVLMLACAAKLPAQKVDHREAPIGVRARIEQVVVAGPKLVVKPGASSDPVMLRILASYPHGSEFRYDLEWVGFEAGRHDLAQFLQREVPATDDPPIGALPVVVTSQLGEGQVEPKALDFDPPADVGGYEQRMLLLGVLWVAGLLLILFAFRRRKPPAPEADAPAPTVADRLRPLVEKAAAGELDIAGKARLERLLLAFWRERAGLQDLPAGEAVIRLRRHPTAGELLHRLEEWLHKPVVTGDVDIPALLAPYRSMRADELDEGR